VHRSSQYIMPSQPILGITYFLTTVVTRFSFLGIHCS
jgi:hypothetical protein